MHNLIMTRQTSRLIFYLALLVFLLAGFYLVVFALGYRYDFLSGKFIETGSVRLITNVPAQILINDTSAGKTSLLANELTKSRLAPGTYSFKATSADYQTWQKNIEVGAGIVADFSNIVLARGSYEEELLATSSLKIITSTAFNIEKNYAEFYGGGLIEIVDLETGARAQKKASANSFSRDLVSENLLSPDEKKTVTATDREIIVSWLADSTNQPLRKKGETELITRFSQPIEKVQWHKDSEHLFIQVGNSLKFIEIDNRDRANIFDINSTTSNFFYDGDEDLVYTINQNKVLKIPFD